MIVVILGSLLAGCIIAYFIKRRDDKIEGWSDKIYEIHHSISSEKDKQEAIEKLLK